MEGNFRNALIIISAIIIGAIFIHGLWTIRKNKNPYKLKAKNEPMEPMEPMERGFDQAGFDQDGVSRARVVESASSEEKVAPELSAEEIPEQPAPAPDYAEEPIPKDFEKSSFTAIAEDPAPDMILEPPVSEDLPKEAEVEAETKAEQAVYQEPVIQAKPQRKRAARKPAKASLKRNQLGFDFDDDLGDLPSITAKDEVPAAAKQPIDPEVMVLSVVMPENQVISGAALLPCLLTLGMKYGEMNIFHRHQDNAGNGKVTFSLANMMNPGTFDLDAMESFATQGVSLFMTLPNAGDPFEVFEQMLAAAKHLAQEFNAQLLDDKRSVMTKQTEQHYIGKIREFDRKSRIAAV